jgi:hypothetical protein
MVNGITSWINPGNTTAMGNAAINAGNFTATSSQNTTIGTARGMYSVASNSGVGTVSTAIGIQGYIGNSSTGTITNAQGVYTDVLNSGGGTITNGYGLYVGNVQATNKWSIYQNDSTAANYFSAFVGIGTNAPTSKLHLQGPTQAFSTNTALFNIESWDAMAVDKGGSLTFSGNDGAASNRTFGAVGGFKENGTSGNYAGYLAFATRPNGGNAAERMRIDSSGNVGIGTTAPASPLQVVGAPATTYTPMIEIKNTNASGTNNYTQMSFAGTGHSYWMGVGNSSETAYTVPNKFYLYDWNASAMRFVVDTSGNMGIGSVSPNEKLDVTGNVEVSGQISTGSKTYTGGTQASIDWNFGNSISTDYTCAGNISFVNLKDGGTYTLVVTNTGTTQCNFSTTTTGTDAATVSYKWRPANATRTASTHTVYTLMRVGTVVYVSWATGFN